MRPIVKASLLLAATCVGQPSMETRMLAAHNKVRRKVNVPPLTWSDKLAASSQEWANTLLARGEFIHRAKSSYGENLLAIQGASASPEEVIDAWDSESEDYNYPSNECSKMCGHYTQLVWASTKQVGCGVARNSRREVWVCEYYPPGNYVGKRPY
jgi:pathogenesis-related protein 1